MSDYLSRAVDRIEPAARPAVRPLLQPMFGSFTPATNTAHPSDVIEEAKESWSIYAKPDAAVAPVQPVSHAVSATSDQVEPKVTAAPLLRIETIHHTMGDPAPAVPAAPSASSVPAVPARLAVPPAAPPLLVEHVAMREISPEPSSAKLTHTVMPAVSVSRALESDAVAPRKAELEINPPREPNTGLNSPQPAVVAAAPLLGEVRAELPPDVKPPAPVTPTVNITIGRLEIRAATPAPERPRPQAPAGRGPLPLDEYLRHRSSRRSRA